jgi:hypothetical protein
VRRRLLALSCFGAFVVLGCGGGTEGGEAPASPLPAPTTTTVEVSGAAANAAWSSPLPNARYDAAEHTASLPGGPSVVAIPAIGVDAEVRPVGVLDDGRLEVPPAAMVGWYQYGSSPGEPGSAVLAGHIAYDGVDGAFRYLAELTPGDEVRVDDATFVVERVEQFRKEQLPPDVWAEDGPSRLVLITCGGSFDSARRSYDSNVVVWARPV